MRRHLLCLQALVPTAGRLRSCRRRCLARHGEGPPSPAPCGHLHAAARHATPLPLAPLQHAMLAGAGGSRAGTPHWMQDPTALAAAAGSRYAWCKGKAETGFTELQSSCQRHDVCGSGPDDLHLFEHAVCSSGYVVMLDTCRNRRPAGGQRSAAPWALAAVGGAYPSPTTSQVTQHCRQRPTTAVDVFFGGILLHSMNVH